MPAISQTVPKEGNLKYALGSTDPFIAEVRPGEVFEVEIGDQLQRRRDHLARQEADGK